MTIFGRAPFNRDLSSFLPFSIFFVLLLVAVAFLHGTAFAGTVTAATGGSAISADTTSAAGGSGAWTSLSGPSYQETVKGDLDNGTVILTVPSGFEFNTGATVSVVLVSGASNDVTNMNGTAVNGNVATTANGTLTVTSTAITFTITSKSKGNVLNKIQWQSIQVRPTSGSPLASGNITPSGTSGIAAVASSSNFGTLTEVAGSATLAFAQQPSDALVNVTISPSVTVQVRDKFGNLVSGSRSVTVTLSSGTGVLSGTATQTTDAAGLATFGDLSINLAGTKALTAASAGVTSAVSNSFIINNPVPTTTSISPASKNIGDLLFVMTVNGTNFVPTSVVRFAGSDRVTTYISSTQLTVTILTSDLTSGGTFAITVFNPTPGGGLSNAQTFTVVSAVSSFDAVEVGAAKATNLYTKLTGTSFSVDILALTSGGGLSTSYASTVTVKLVDASSGACAAMTVLQDYGSSTFTAGTGRKTLSLSYASAARNARIRINDATAGITACSTDNFTIRPQSFTVTANLGGTTLKAGNDFTMTAATAVTAGYTGTPVLNTALVQDHNALAAGTLNGTFAAATVASATGTFQYHDVGTISLLANAVTDSAYTSVDQASDCVSGSTSNTLAGGKYGCNVGSVAAGPFGRFYPHHFIYAATLTPACVAGGFTYMDQAALGLGLTLSAKSADETTTVRYTAGYSPLGTFAITGDNSGTVLSLARLSPVLPAFAWSNGVYNVTGNRAFTRNATPDGPYDSFALKAVVTDADGAIITGTDLSNLTKIRHGRVRLLNAYGSELLALPVPFRIEYWQGTAAGWQINAADTCTPIAASNFAFAFPAGNETKPNNLAACETALSVSGSAPNYLLSLSKPGSGNNGWSDLTLNLGATALPGNTQCVVVGGPGVADVPANMSWLQYNWTGTIGNPKTRATFGIYKSPLIYRRENY